MSALPLPKNFDGNEWYFLTAVVFSYAMIFPLRKRFPSTIKQLSRNGKSAAAVYVCAG